MMTYRQQQLFEQFRESTHANEHLNAEEGIIVGLTAAMALDCKPCLRYYISLAKRAGISEGKVSEVLAKVMVVSANKKRLSANDAMHRCFGKEMPEDVP